MINSLEEIAALLEGAELETSTKIELAIPDSPNCAFAIKVNGENSLRAWSLLKSLVDETGRYPVLAGESSSPFYDWAGCLIRSNPFCRQEFQYELYSSEDKNVFPESIIERSKTIDITQKLEEDQRNKWHFLLEEAIDFEIERMSAKFGVTPSKEEMFAAFPSCSGEISNDIGVEVEKWLFDWERSHLPAEVALAPPDLQDLYLDWYNSSDEFDYSLILLPTANSWETPAYIHWFGVGNKSSEVIVTLLQSWHDRFKAELVAHDGLNLLFNVHQRPVTPEAAFQLAVEQEAFAGDTLYLPGISIRDHARALLYLDRWYLLSKP